MIAIKGNVANGNPTIFPADKCTWPVNTDGSFNNNSVVYRQGSYAVQIYNASIGLIDPNGDFIPHT